MAEITDDEKFIEIIGFEGMQNTTSRFLKKKEELDLAQSADFDEVGSVGKRLGYSQRGSSLDDATSTSTSTSTSSSTSTSTSTTTTA